MNVVHKDYDVQLHVMTMTIIDLEYNDGFSSLSEMIIFQLLSTF
jgi:hypothetical protein